MDAGASSSRLQHSEAPRRNPIDKLAQKLYQCVQNNDVSKARHLQKGLDKAEKRRIASYTFQGNAPLFIAAKKGHVHLVRHLIYDWNADIEQTGIYEVASDHSKHQVTPLWCAAVANRFDVVKFLVPHGADINATSDTESTPVRSACYMTNIEVVKYLVESGCDIHKPNHNGGTCLINSVQSAELCQYLIEHGVDVNAHDNTGNTALHYAIREGRTESVKLLIASGSDAFMRNDMRDDALITASLRGNSEILEYLVATVDPPIEQVIDAFELMATNFVDEKHDLQTGIEMWRRALTMRTSDPQNLIPKTALREPNEAYVHMKEAQSLTELESIVANPDAIYMQSLLTRERILGPDHKDTVFGLMYRGAVYADTHQYQRCVDLWKYAFMLRHEKSGECIFTLQALCKLFWEIYEEFIARHTEEYVRFDDVFHVLTMAIKEVLHKSDNDSTHCCFFAFDHQLEPGKERDTMLLLILHLVHLLCKISNSPHRRRLVQEQVILLLRSGIRAKNEQSLLHLATDNKGSSISDEFYSHFPSYEVIGLLIESGCNVNALDADRNSALHICAEGLNQLLTQQKYRETVQEVVDLLLRSGAHIDIVNKRGINSSMLLQNRCPNVRVIDHISLKCLAARVIKDYRLEYRDGIVPYTLVPFIDLHGTN